MAQTPPNLLYIVVVDDEDKSYSSRFAFSASSASSSSSRYTRSSLQNTLQLMGCKARHSFKISQRVFEVMRNEFHATASHLTEKETSKSNTHGGLFDRIDSIDTNGCMDDHDDASTLENSQINNSIQFDLYKKLTTVFVCRENFLNVVRQALSQYKYVGPKQRNDLTLACRIRERKDSFTVLLCGTSGCGKSTLSSLLGSRLGVTTVVSTDSIRHMMRSFVDEKKNPLLWSSTYHAGEHLDPVAVAKAKCKAKILAGFSHSSKGELSDTAKFENDEIQLIGERQMAIEGFKAQCEMVIESLDRLITAWEEKRESVIIEGVHLSLNFVMGLMKKHPSIIPFMVYISNEDKHMERFAVRAQYMTLDPSKNKYVKYIRNIRAIQEYLCKRADKHLVPKVNNTNVDKSVAAIHASSVAFIRRSLPFLTAAMSTETRSTAIEHFVLLSTKPSTPAPQIDSMVANLRSLSSLPNVTHLTIEPVLRHRSSAAEPFSYVIHGRYPTKTDLAAYSDHPSHLSVVKDSVRPTCCDVLALDWVTGSEHGAVGPGSAARLTLVKVKEGAGESAKGEILEVMRGAKVKGEVSFGENFSQGRSKGYEIGMVAVFKNLEELDELDNLGEELEKQKQKVRDLIESVIVVDFVVSGGSPSL